MILFHVKFFNERSHAEEFVAGNLYLQTLGAFARLKDENDGRADPLEGIWSIHQPHPDLIMEIGGVRINPADLAGPIVFTRPQTLTKHALCLYGAHAASETVEAHELEGFIAGLRVDADYTKMGKFAVLVHHVTKFRERLLRAAEREQVAPNGERIRSYDYNRHSGQIEEGFSKSDTFKQQKEFRFLFDSLGQWPETMRLEVGDLSDICAHMSWEALQLVDLQRP